MKAGAVLGALGRQVKVLKKRVRLHAGVASQGSTTLLMTKNQEDTELVIAQHM